MKTGDRVYTPRFCNVQINEVFDSRESCFKAGYIEPTYYNGEYDIRGKSIDMYHMVFAAYRKEEAK